MANLIKMDDKKKAQFLDLMRSGYSITSAGIAMNISRSTVWKARKEDKKFGDAVMEAREQCIELVEDQVYSNAIHGKETSAIFFLCNRAPDRWKSVNKIEAKITLMDLVDKLPPQDMKFVLINIISRMPEDDIRETIRCVSSGQPVLSPLSGRINEEEESPR